MKKKKGINLSQTTIGIKFTISHCSTRQFIKNNLKMIWIGLRIRLVAVFIHLPYSQYIPACIHKILQSQKSHQSIY
jgi:hypothetical protein